jgi:cellulose synthase/poly-beta-1,6-N-acetylglucosamine synthase-like glycosyltransferase
MCNGANFAYKKSFFQEIGGFNGNDQIASGDDVFLLQKAIARFPKEVHYLMSKSNIVRTKPLNDWKMLFHQRVRWVSKTVSFQSVFGIGLGLVVFITNTTWLFILGFLLFGLISFQTVFVFSLLKFSVEIILVNKANQFLTNKKLQYLFMGVLYYPFFSTNVVLHSLFGKYEWKGRRFKY